MPRRGENIYKRKDGRWEARYIKYYTEDGKAIYGYLYARSYRDVRTKLQQHSSVSETKDALDQTDGSDDKFRVIAENWLSAIMPQLKASSYNKYRNQLDLYIIPRFGELALSEITHDLIERQCFDLLQFGGKDGTGLSPKTATDILSVIRNILKFAVRSGLRVPSDGKSVVIKRPAYQIRVLTKNEQARLFDYLYSNLDDYNVGILVCLFTGLRVGEICALKWEDISFADQVIHVHQTMQRIQDKTGGTRKTRVILSSPKSACSVRAIPITNEIMQLMRSHKKAEEGYFLTNSAQRFIEPRSMQNHFKYALKACGVSDANFHALRHTFATRCVELGFDVKSLSEILGHANVNITMNRYVHPSMELKKENMQRLSELFAVK